MVSGRLVDMTLTGSNLFRRDWLGTMGTLWLELQNFTTGQVSVWDVGVDCNKPQLSKGAQKNWFFYPMSRCPWFITSFIYIYNPLKSSEQFRCFIHVIILQFVVMVDPCILRDPTPQVTDTALAQMLVDLPTVLVGGLEHFPIYWE